MARLADIQAARLAGALLTGDAVKRGAILDWCERNTCRNHFGFLES